MEAVQSYGNAPEDWWFSPQITFVGD